MDRFYKNVTIAEQHGGFVPMLDGRPVKTPMKKPLVCPSRTLAQLAADEWAAVEGKINLSAMFHTRLVATAIDFGESHHANFINEITKFLEGDTLLYHHPADRILQQRQQSFCTPLLAWFAQESGLKLIPTQGLNPVLFDRAVIQLLLEPLTTYQLIGLNMTAILTKSFLVSWGLFKGRLSAAEAYKASTFEEARNREIWGADREGDVQLENLKAELSALETYLKAVA